MRCKLFHFASRASNPSQSRRLFWPSQSNWTLVILLSLALFGFTATIRAQEAANPEAASPKTTNQDASGAISGTVYLPGSKEPASQVAISLRSHHAGVFRSILTDYDGHFEVSGLPAGKYEVTIEEQGYQTYRSTAEFDGSSLKLELHLTSLTPPQPMQSANSVSVRELAIPGKAQEEYR